MNTVGMIGARGVDSNHIGGIEAVVGRLSMEMASRDIKVQVYVRSYCDDQQISSDNYNIVAVPTLFTKHLETFVYSLLSSLHAARSCDVVHFHGVGPSLMCWIPRLFCKKVVVTVHGADWRRDKWGLFPRFMLLCGLKLAKYFSHCITAVSSPCADEVSKMISREVIVIPNGISKPAAAIDSRPPAHLDLLTGGYYLFLGRLVNEKRVGLLIKAFREIPTDKKLVIAGDAPYGSRYRHELERMAEDDARIALIGAITGRDKFDLLAHAYCMVLPSAIEGHAVVLLEAIDASVPIVCSNIPENEFALGLLDPSEDFEQTGVTFESDNKESLKDALLFAEYNSDLLKKFARNANRQLAGRFSWSTIVSRYISLY